MLKTKNWGTGAYLMLVGDVCAVLSLIGCFWLGIGLSTASLCLVLGILSSFFAIRTGRDLLAYPSYLLYIAAFGFAIYAELYNISNVLVAIDASGFPPNMFYTGVMLVVTVIVGFAATIAKQKK
mgnify:CR=1 FL=1